MPGPRRGHRAGPGAERHLASMGTVSPWTGRGATSRSMILAAAAPGTVLKLHGTNMAFAARFCWSSADSIRRSATISTTPTCPASCRCGAPGQWLPDAQVHHAFAASDAAHADRVPLSLFDIGASTVVFLRKHAPDAMDDALRRLAEDQRARLFRFVRRRKLGARDSRRPDAQPARWYRRRDGRAHSENASRGRMNSLP
jgi:hypothetical protein